MQTKKKGALAFSPFLHFPLTCSFEGCSIHTGLRKTLSLFRSPTHPLFRTLSPFPFFSYQPIACGYYLFNIFVIASLSLTTNYVLRTLFIVEFEFLIFGFSVANSITQPPISSCSRFVTP